MIFLGQEYYDKASNRIITIMEHRGENWLCYKHPDGQWVTLRKPTEEDIEKLENASPSNVL